jgi:hypothetical protein
LTKNCFAFGAKHHVSIDNLQFTIHNLKDYLQEKGHLNIEIREIEPSVEDCFMQLSQNP